MKSLWFLVCLILISSLLAQVPLTLNYQGKLTDPEGVAVDSPVDIVFSLYSAPTGGTLLWSENHASVPVNNGLFDVVLGAVSPFNLDFARQYYIELTVGGETLTPRTPLTSAPYAIMADSAMAVHWDDVSGRPSTIDTDPTNELITAGSYTHGTHTLTITEAGADWDIDLSALDNAGSDDQTDVEVPLTSTGDFAVVFGETEVHGALVDIDDAIVANQTDIATNTADIATNTADIATNTADIATNTADIATNAGDIAGHIAADGDLDDTNELITAGNYTHGTHTLTITEAGADWDIDLSALDNAGSDDQTDVEVPLTSTGDFAVVSGETEVHGALVDLDDAIVANQTDIATNTADIATNAGDIAGHITADGDLDDTNELITAGNYTHGTHTLTITEAGADWDIDLSALDNAGSDDQTDVEVPLTSTGDFTVVSGETEVHGALVDLDDAIVANQNDIATNTADIATNTADIATNTADIATNTGNIAGHIAADGDLNDTNELITAGSYTHGTHTLTITEAGADWDIDLSALDNSGSDDQTDVEVPLTSTGDFAVVFGETEVHGALVDLDDAIVVNQNDIATNTADIATNTAGIATNTIDIATNTADIATNTADITGHIVADGDLDDTNEAQSIAGSGTSSFTLTPVGSTGGGIITLTGTGGASVTRVDNTFTIDASAAGEDNQTIITGAGLTGAESPGTSGNFTVSVNTGDGLRIDGDNVAVNTSDLVGNGLTESSNNLHVNFAGSGSANTVSRSDHNHSGAYDNYGSWTATPNDGGTSVSVTSGTNLVFDGTGGIAVTRGTGNTIAIDGTGTADGNNYVTGASFSGTSTKTLTLTRSGLTNLTANFTDDNTTYSAGNGISLSTTTFSVAGGSGLQQEASGLRLLYINAGSSNQGALWYNGVGKVAGNLYGGTTNPTNTDRLNYDGYFYATRLYSNGAQVLTGNQNITLSDDVSGSGTTSIAATVQGLQGRSVASTAPSSGQVLKWNGSSWAPAADAEGSGDGNNYVTGVSFNTSTGDLTLTRSGLSSLTTGLDGRYLTSYTETDPTWSGTANTTSNIGRTGNVGIGTASPTYRLDVSGTTRMNGDFYNQEVGYSQTPINVAHTWTTLQTVTITTHGTGTNGSSVLLNAFYSCYNYGWMGLRITRDGIELFNSFDCAGLDGYDADFSMFATWVDEPNVGSHTYVLQWCSYYAPIDWYSSALNVSEIKR